MEMEDRRIQDDFSLAGSAPWPLPEPVTIGDGRTEVHLRPLAQGRDFLVLITGGAAHVGAVAVRDGRIAGPEKADSVGTVQLHGHREGPLAAEAAALLAAATGRTCAAVVGIHQDDASPAEIRRIVTHVRRGLRQLVVAFVERKPS